MAGREGRMESVKRGEGEIYDILLYSVLGLTLHKLKLEQTICSTSLVFS